MSLSDVFTYFFFALWVFLPAGLGNMAPILVAKVSWTPLRKWTNPIDLGRTFRGKRIFGAHKTWRGLVCGMIVATITLAVQQLLFKHSHTLQAWITTVDFAHLSTLIVGPLFGFGALAGDAIKSFFKRQRGVGPGETWFPFDQLDLPAGALAATWPFIHPTALQSLYVLFVWCAAQLVSSYIGYLLHLKDKPI